MQHTENNDTFTVEVIRYSHVLYPHIGSLRGFAKVFLTFDAGEFGYVKMILTDIRIIEKDGRLFIAMPSRRIMRTCTRCSQKNCVDAEYCNWCQHRLPMPQYRLDARGREVRYADIAYPVCQQSRDVLQTAILQKYEQATPVEKMPE